jgi:mutator protein MutT
VIPIIHVVAGAVIDAASRILIAQRPPGKHLAGGWEFPGGKLEAGEPNAVGLARELREELGIEIHSPRPLVRLQHTYAYGHVLLDVWVVRRYHGEPRGVDGQPLRWCRLDELEDERATAGLLPADRPIVRALRLPERLVKRSTPYYTVDGDAGAAVGAIAGASAVVAGARESAGAGKSPGSGAGASAEARAGDTRMRGAFCSDAAEAEVLAGAEVGLATADRPWTDAGGEAGAGAVPGAGGGAEAGGGAGARSGSGVGVGHGAESESGSGVGYGTDAKRGGGAAMDFLVLRTAISPNELAALCRSVAVPVYARGIELEAAWELGATGVSLV